MPAEDAGALKAELERIDGLVEQSLFAARSVGVALGSEEGVGIRVLLGFPHA